MEVMGVAVAILGIILAYMWRANGQTQKYMAKMLANIEQSLENIAAGQKEIAQGQKEIAQMLFNQTRILERIEARIGKV